MNTGYKNIIHAKVVATDLLERTQYVDTELVNDIENYTVYDVKNMETNTST